MPASIAALVACILLAARLRATALARARLDAEVQAADRQLRDLRRAATLAASDLRQAALRLHTAAPASSGAARSLALCCRSIAEDLAAAASRPGTPRLEEDLLDLQGLAGEALAATQAAIAPGRRALTLASASDRPLVWADQRAIREALGRLLAEAVLDTCEGDAICVAIEPSPAGGVALVVADEGAAASARPSGMGAGDTRGLPGRLSLPRVLIEAHGGHLELLAARGAGTRASLVFPPERVRRGFMTAHCPAS